MACKISEHLVTFRFTFIRNITKKDDFDENAPFYSMIWKIHLQIMFGQQSDSERCKRVHKQKKENTGMVV